MDSETAISRDAGRVDHLPGWPAPAGFLAYFLLFHYFVDSGRIMLAMAFGMMAVPVLIIAAVCSVAVAVRLVSGAYRKRLSWPGLLAWSAVAAICVAMAVQILR